MSPSSPFLVVITITPGAPAVPYRAVAAEPLSMLILSISSLFKSIKRFEVAVPAVLEPEFNVSLFVMIPSITISGWLFPIMDVTPRISILEPPPADPADLVICTPAALPTKASSALLDPEFTISSLPTVWIEYPRALASLLIPSDVTTTSSSSLA